MGFFKEFKDDLSQAVNELLPEEDLLQEVYTDEEVVNTLDENSLNENSLDEEKNQDNLTENLSEHNVDPELLDFITKELENQEAAKDITSEELSEHEVEEVLEVVDVQAKEKEEDNKHMTMDKEVKLESIDMESEMSFNESDNLTVITKGTRISGSIISDGSLEIRGQVDGDIECQGKLSITGNVHGNSMAKEVFVNTSRMDGSISSEGSVKIGVGTVVVGDITASSAVIAGAVKGEVDVNGPVILDSTAIVKGNIKTKSVQINNGAVVDGYCSLSYASIDIDNFFE